MPQELINLINAAKGVTISPQEAEEQRISFAYGNTHFENEAITRDMVREAAAVLRQDDNTALGHAER
jgi:hypothetical protein